MRRQRHDAKAVGPYVVAAELRKQLGPTAIGFDTFVMGPCISCPEGYNNQEQTIPQFKNGRDV